VRYYTTKHHLRYGLVGNLVGLQLGLKDNNNKDVVNIKDDDNNKLSNNEEDLVLTEIKARVVAHDAKLHAQMIKANSS